ncbi:rRNA-processing protein bfr2 [Malassezia nana]|uniref:Protein BFR2 n=1 Tax=Malassezia nana TaxID=180528 RepID=A0AAF0EH38_9BASI|nr:rRNA-processing protein bfr2 [Malassezia nana]
MAHVDPDKEYETPPSSSDEESASEEEFDGRQHYVEVGPSEMRRRARLTESDKLDQARYKGEKVSRHDMFNDDLDASDDVTSASDSAEEEDDQTDEAYEDAEDDKEVESDEADQEPTASHVNKEPASPEGVPESAATLNSQEQESRTLLQQLQAQRTQDAKKGRHLQKQIRNWEKALRLRIALQKVITSLARLPPPEMMDDYLTAAPGTAEDVDVCAAELEGLAQSLLSVRLHLWKQNMPDMAAELDTVNTEASSGKALHDLEALAEPRRRSLLSRWSSKISAAPDSLSASATTRLQLRAMNQSVVEQMDQALAGDGMDRLVDRTRVWRGDETARLGRSEPVEEMRARPTDVHVFDDSDFYAQLLRDLIDHASMVEAGISATASDALRSRKRKRNVDVRASKGRRIRYDVLEKVQNFMPPIPRVTWDDAQAERLFARLASVTPQGVAPEPADEDVPLDDEFRLLG